MILHTNFLISYIDIKEWIIIFLYEKLTVWAKEAFLEFYIPRILLQILVTVSACFLESRTLLI